MSGAPSVGGAPSQPPTIRENEDQSIKEVTKKYVLSMVMDTLAEAIPFTQREYDEVFQYKSEADRPTLHPMMHLRISGLEPYTIQEDAWQPLYQELFNSLPKNVKTWLSKEMNLPFNNRDPGYQLVNNLLTTTAKALVWLSVATRPTKANTAAEKSYLLNVALPFIALRGIASQSEKVLTSAKAYADLVGANAPYYDALTNLLSETESAVSNLEKLKKEVESGNPAPNTKEQFVDLAYEFSTLCKQLKSTSPLNGHLKILETTLQTLATVSAAWSLEGASPSLFLAMTAAETALSSSSAAGFLGEAYSGTINSLTDGILTSLDFGPRAELQELSGLYGELTALLEV